MYDTISPSHHCEKCWPSLQCCFNLLSSFGVYLCTNAEVVDLLMCLGAVFSLHNLIYAKLQMLDRASHLSLKYFWYIEEFMDDSKVSRFCGCKTDKMILDSRYEVLKCCIWFSSNLVLCIWLNIFLLISSTQKSCCLFRCNFTNLSRVATFFLERRGFLLPPFQTSHTFSVFNMLTEAIFQSWEIFMGINDNLWQLTGINWKF